MSIGPSKDTLIANVAQQISALLLLIAIPNLLSVEHFSETVFVGIVLSFTRFSDLGLSAVYSREVPRHLTLGETADVDLWNRTVFWFGVLGAGIAGGLAASVMYVRYDALTDALLVMPLPILTTVTVTFVLMVSNRGDFLAYRNNVLRLSLARLIAIPFSLLSGLLGWLVAQVVSLGVIAARLGTLWIPRPRKIDWALIGRNLPAAMQLAMITLLWSQLMDAGRLLASIFYPAEGLAIYGLLITGYQSLLSLLISVYLPVSVKTLGLLARSDREAAEYVFGVIHRSLHIVFVIAIAGAELSPWILNVVFPKYRIDALMPQAILYSVTLLPFVATLGNLLIGKRMNIMYLGILVVSLAATVGFEQLLRPEIGIRAAAVAQACGVLTFAVLLLIAIWYLLAANFQEVGRAIRASVVRLGTMWAAYVAFKLILAGL